MATAGDIYWADLISRMPIDAAFYSDTTRVMLIATVNKSPITVFSYRLEKDFTVRGFRLPVPTASSSVSLTLYLQLTRRFQSTRSVYAVTLHWDHYLLSRKSGLWFVFPFVPYSVYFVNEVKLVSSYASPVWVKKKIYLHPTRRPFRPHLPSYPLTLTPSQIITLSMKSGSLRGGFKLPVRPSPTGFPQSQGFKLRPNPESRDTTYESFKETNGTDFHSTGFRTYNSYFRSFSSVNTPGFKSKKKSQLPVNPYSMHLVVTNWYSGMDRRKLTTSPFYDSIWSENSNSIWSNLNLPVLPFDTAVSNSAIKRCTDDAQASINANIAQDVAQIHQLVNLVADTTTRIVGVIRNLRHGNIVGATSALFHGRNSPSVDIKRGKPSVTKSIANNWLELQYGWKPLLMDIDGAMRTVANILHGPRCVQLARGSARKTVNDKFDLDTVFVQPIHLGARKTATDFGCRLGIYFKPDSPLTEFLGQTGFTNPINLAWEILPWSFVVDWFLPVGSYLEALSAFQGMEFVSGFQTTFQRTTILNDLWFRGLVGTTNILLQWDGGGTFLQVDVGREKLVAFPSSVFPHIKNPVSVIHGLNGIALLRQTFGR